MSIDVNPVLAAFDEAIEELNEQIAEREASRDHLQALRDQTAARTDGDAVVAPTPPETPPKKAKPSQPNFTARGLHYIHQISEALKRGDKTVARLRDIIGTSAITNYLDHLEAEGLAKPTGERRTTRGRKVQRTSPVWTWTGGDTTLDSAEPEDAIQPAFRRRRKRRRKSAKPGEVQKKVQEALAALNGAPFTKAGIARSLEPLRYQSVDAELRRAEKAGEIVQTGRKVRGPKGHMMINEYRVAGSTPSAPTEPTGGNPPEAERREHRIQPGIGITPGRVT